MFKIALDAGHGKGTPGKRCDKKIDKNQTREWVLNSRICEKIEQKLEAYEGYALLRVDDTTGKKDVSLYNRCKYANNFDADIYLSIHHNAGVKGGAGGGIVVYTWKKPDEELQEWQKLFYDNLIAKTGLKGNRSKPLSTGNYYVLNATKMQAILVENGFMDSTTDVPIILTDDFADKAAQAYVKTLVKIGGLKKKEKAPTVTTKETKSYKVRVTDKSLNIRKGAGTNYKVVGKITDKGVYTIVAESTGKGSKKGWGKLKSGVGWISLDFCKKV